MGDPRVCSEFDVVMAARERASPDEKLVAFLELEWTIRVGHPVLLSKSRSP